MSEAAYIFPTEVIRVDYDCSVDIETPIPAGFSSGWAAAREESFSQAAAATVSPHLLRYPGNRRMAGAEWQAVLIRSPVNPRESPPFVFISIGIGDPIKTVRFPAHLSLLPPWLHSFFFHISLLDTSEAKRDTNWTRALNKCCNGSPYKYKAVFSLGFIAIM